MTRAATPVRPTTTRVRRRFVFGCGTASTPEGGTFDVTAEMLEDARFRDALIAAPVVEHGEVVGHVASASAYLVGAAGGHGEVAIADGDAGRAFLRHLAAGRARFLTFVGRLTRGDDDRTSFLEVDRFEVRDEPTSASAICAEGVPA